MVEINLLPEQKKRTKLLQLTPKKLILIVSLVIFLAVVGVCLIFIKNYYCNDLEKLETKITELQAEASNAALVSQEVAALEEQLGTYSHLFNNQPKWGEILADINDIIPSELWLTRLQVS